MSGRPTLDLNLLHTLDALFLCRQVTKAAQMLGVTQPSVSHKLRRLREHFNDPLFVRAGNDLEPTPRALALRDPIQGALRELTGHINKSTQFDAATESRTFSLCIPDSTELTKYAPFVKAFRQEAPNCRLRSLRVQTTEIAEALESGRIDIAVGALLVPMPPTLRQSRLFTYDYVCIAARGSPVARASLTLAQYCSLPHVLITRSGAFENYLLQALKRQKIERNAATSLSNNLVAAQLVAESNLIATVPRAVGECLARMFPLALLELPFALPAFTSRLYWHERFHLDPANRWFREFARSQLRRPRKE